MFKSLFFKKQKKEQNPENFPYLIVGLGNPGPKYEKTRHNVGFKATDKIVDDFQFPFFEFQSKFNAEISKKPINNQDVIIAKPGSFMNLSGAPVSKIAGFYKIPSEKTIIIHDDIDVPLGKIKIAKSKGSGGHKGVKSIIQKTGSNNFIRVRVGICPEKKPINPEIFVLQKFKSEEENLIENVLKKTAKAVDMIIKEGADKAASLFNNSNPI